MEEQYIGEHEISDYKLLEDETSPMDNDVYLVEFEGEHKEPMRVSERVWDHIVTEEAKDASYVLNQKLDILVPTIVDLITEWNIKFAHISRVVKKVHEHMENKLERASSYLWNNTDAYWTPGFNFTNNIQALQIKNVLDDIDNDKETNEDESGDEQ